MMPDEEESKGQGDATGSDAGYSSRAIALGMNLAAGMAVFTFLGYWIDTRRGGGPGPWTLAGMFTGLLYGAYEVWKVVRPLNRENNKARGRSPGERKQ
jgi:hypothetical protein